MEAFAGLDHGVPGEGAHHLHDLCLQGGYSVMRGFVSLLFTNIAAHSSLEDWSLHDLLGGQTLLGQNSQ